jgi:serine/threonine-protein kinase
MVTGRAPFYGSRGDVLNAHNCTTPPRPSKFARIAPALEAIILKAISKDPANRFQSGAEFATALAECDLYVQRTIWPRFLWLFCCPTQMMQAS